LSVAAFLRRAGGSMLESTELLIIDTVA